MPDEIHGYALFPGLNGILSCSYTNSHGITPGVAQLTCVPQPEWEPETGELVLFDGVTSIPLPDCKVENHAIDSQPSGHTWQIAILDRRWKWRWGEISGAYNLRGADGTVIVRTEKTPVEIINTLLTAMGEAIAYDTSAVDDTARPLVQWDHDVPAVKLQELCEQLGLRIVYRISDNTVQLETPGIGADLPTGGELDDSLTVDPPERPDRIKCVGAKVRWQVQLTLEAVGLDTDGQIKPIAELSYTPTTGWASTFPPYFANLATAEANRLARMTVYRWYRITVTDASGAGTVFLPGFGRILFIEQILPLWDETLETAVDSGDNAVAGRPRKAYLSGIYARADLGVHTNTAAGTSYKEPFTIDKENGIVQFSKYAFRWVATNNPSIWQVGEATLKLVTSVNVLDPYTNAPICFEHEREFDDGQTFGTPTEIIRHEEIERQIQVLYFSDGTISGINDNQADAEAEADVFLDYAVLAYETKTPQSKTYTGLRAINCDGKVQQVTWEVGPSGCTTKASTDTEHSYVVPDIRQRIKDETVTANRFRALQQQRAASDYLAAYTARGGRPPNRTSFVQGS